MFGLSGVEPGMMHLSDSMLHHQPIRVTAPSAPARIPAAWATNRLRRARGDSLPILISTSGRADPNPLGVMLLLESARADFPPFSRSFRLFRVLPGVFGAEVWNFNYLMRILQRNAE